MWNTGTKKIEYEFELADAFGDGEWYFVKDAWLTDLNKDGKLDIITREKDWTGDDESTTSKAQITDSIKVYIALQTYFEQKQIAIDTKKYNLTNWKD